MLEYKEGVGPRERRDFSNEQDTSRTQDAPFNSVGNEDGGHSGVAISLLDNGGTNELKSGKKYRVISDNDFYFVQGYEDYIGAADMTKGTWVPAKTPIVVEASRWQHIRVQGSGIIQAVELG